MVTSMLEKAIEIEGLLRIIRDGNPLPETYILLNMKAAELAEQAESLEEKGIGAERQKPQSEFMQETSESGNVHADFVMETTASNPTAIPEVVFSVEMPTEEEGSPGRSNETLSDLGDEDYSMTPEDLALIEEDDIILSFEENTEFAPSTAAVAAANSLNPTPESAPESVTEPEPPLHKESTDTATEDLPNTIESDAIEESVTINPTESEADTSPDHQSETQQEPEATPKIEVTPKINVESTRQAAPKRQAKLRASFSLNDRFLYARELFNGNMKMFDSTLDFLEGIEDYSIIEDYFYSELEWDPDNSNVAAFMNILRPNFKE